MSLLGELRVLERGIGCLEIGAGILPVAVEEQVIERARQIVVMGDIGFRLADRIVLVEPFQGDSELVEEFGCAGIWPILDILQEHFEQIIDRPVGELDLAIHVSLAEEAVGIENDLRRRAPVEEFEAGRPARPVAIDVLAPASIGHAQLSDLNQVFYRPIEYCKHSHSPALPVPARRNVLKSIVNAVLRSSEAPQQGADA